MASCLALTQLYLNWPEFGTTVTNGATATFLATLQDVITGMEKSASRRGIDRSQSASLVEFAKNLRRRKEVLMAMRHNDLRGVERTLQVKN